MESTVRPDMYELNIRSTTAISSGTAASAPFSRRYPKGGVKPMVLFPESAFSRDSAFSRIPMWVLSPICSLSSWAMRCIMSTTNLPRALVVSRDSVEETNFLPFLSRCSIIAMKLRLFLWMRSIFITRRTSHLSISDIILR